MTSTDAQLQKQRSTQVIDHLTSPNHKWSVREERDLPVSIAFREKSIDDTGSGLYQYWCVAVLVLVIMTRMLILIKYIVNKHILFLIGKYCM